MDFFCLMILRPPSSTRTHTHVPDTTLCRSPPQPVVFEQVNYYRTALHELTHASGQPSRLDRKLLNAFGSKDYAREELVAEMGSAFLCAALGIVPNRKSTRLNSSH